MSKFSDYEVVGQFSSGHLEYRMKDTDMIFIRVKRFKNGKNEYYFKMIGVM